MDFFQRSSQKNTSLTYSAPNLGKRELLSRREKFSFKGLSMAELDKIVAVCGALAEDVTPLTEGQLWIAANDQMLSERFYLQALFKVKGFIRPQVFSERVARLIRENAILRTLFLRGDGGRILPVVLKQREAEVRFHDLVNQPPDAQNRMLEKIMASDRRRGFHLEKDRLLRIGVFRTGFREYAVLVAQPQLVADGWDIGLLFSELFRDEETDTCRARQLPKRNFSFTAYLAKRGEQDKAPALQYWRKLLQGVRRPSEVPGCKSTDAYLQSVCSALLDRDLTEALQGMAGNGSAGLISLLEAAWGIMLQQYNRSNDAIFGVILSNRSARLDNIEVSASIVNVMPVRVNCPIDMTAEELLRKQQLQMALSQPYSYCSAAELEEVSGAVGALFNHFLNFHGFSTEERYSDVDAVFGVTPVGVNSFDCCSVDFSVYFRRAAQGIQIEFAYNSAAFAKAQVELLQQGFLAVLRQIRQRPSMQVCEIKMPSLEQIAAAAVDARAMKEEIRAFLSQIRLFANLPEVMIAELADRAKLEYFVEGDALCREGMRQETFYVVYSGNVEISRSADTGWSGSLKILKRGSILGYEGILDQRPSSVRAEALHGDVRVIAIPNKELGVLMRKNFDLVANVMAELNDQINKLQKLWVSMHTSTLSGKEEN